MTEYGEIEACDDDPDYAPIEVQTCETYDFSDLVCDDIECDSAYIGRKMSTDDKTVLHLVICDKSHFTKKKDAVERAVIESGFQFEEDDSMEYEINYDWISKKNKRLNLTKEARRARQREAMEAAAPKKKGRKPRPTNRMTEAVKTKTTAQTKAREHHQSELLLDAIKSYKSPVKLPTAAASAKLPDSPSPFDLAKFYAGNPKTTTGSN